jgi:hypothetical protein
MMETDQNINGNNLNSHNTTTTIHYSKTLESPVNEYNKWGHPNLQSPNILNSETNLITPNQMMGKLNDNP